MQQIGVRVCLEKGNFYTVKPTPIPMQYITKEDGERVGVVLSWQDFQELRIRLSDDPDLLSEVSFSELQALADGMLAPEHQDRLSELLSRNQEQTLTEREAEELDQLLAKIDALNLLKARAKLTLQSLQSGSGYYPPL
jgi:hypothetical protein